MAFSPGRLLPITLMLFTSTACEGPLAPDSGVDAGGSVVDAGDADLDAGQPDVDAGELDADAGDADAGDLDAGALDAGAPDADAGDLDAGALDAGAPDAGAGDLDAGALDVDGGAIDGGLNAFVFPRLNAIRQKSTHNSYERNEALVDQLIYHRVRSVELDIHNAKSGRPNAPGNWFVYHGPSTETTCHQLTDCFDELRLFHALAPDHDVISVWIDLKDTFDFASGHSPTDLDALISSNFGDAVLTPGDLADACAATTGTAPASLRDAVTGACSWPRVDESRGRLMFFLTGGSSCDVDGRLEDYAGQGSSSLSRQGFIAPDVNGGCTYASYADRDHVVMFNLNVADGANAVEVRNAGLASRTWGVNSIGAWNQVGIDGTNHIATDKVNVHQDAWARTHAADGFPFECRVGADCNLDFRPATPVDDVEGGTVLTVQVDSEDIWETADDFVFAGIDRTATPDGAWTTWVSTVNSHVEPFAKGCLMARTELAANAAYFAVCRPADIAPVRTQTRATAGATTTETTVDLVGVDTVDQESVGYVRLVLSAGGTCARGEGSQDGTTWTLISEACFATPLVHQGAAASSHGSAEVRFHFVNLEHSVLGRRLRPDLTVTEIGTVRGALSFDGFAP